MSNLFERIKAFKVLPSIKNVFKMMFGTMSGQVISILLVPVTARIYGAQSYGELAVLTSMSSILIGFLGFGLASAIMVEKTNEEAQQTYKMEIFFTNVLVVVLTVVLLFLSPWVKIFDTVIPYEIAVLILAISVIFTNQINMLYAWLNRNGRYNILLFNPMITPVVNNLLAIVMGLIGFKSVGLYVGLLFSQFITVLHMFFNMDKMSYRFKFKDIPTIIKRNKDFIFYQYPSGMMNSIVGNLPVQILSYFFGNTTVGYYSMAMRLLNIPTSLISSSMSRVYFKDAADKHRNGENARAYTLKICKILTLIYLVPMSLIILFGDIAIPFFLGKDWAQSVEYLKIMSIWNLFAISINSSAGFSSIIGRQKINMFMSVIKLIAFPISMGIISIVFNQATIAVWTYAIIYSIINIAYYEKLIGEDMTLRGKYLIFNILALFICVIIYLLSYFLKSLFL